MHKYRYRANPKMHTANIDAERKRAFCKGQPRADNPYAITSLALADIWWNGWDKGEEELKADQSHRVVVLKVLDMLLKGRNDKVRN